MKFLLRLALVWAIVPMIGHAQFRAGGYVGTLIDDNTLNNYLQIADRITELNIKGAYDWDSDIHNVQLFYSGSLNYFSVLPSRTFQFHEGGLAYSYLASEEAGTIVNTGVSMTMRANREEYELYDHSQLSLYANIRTTVADLLLIKTGYSFRAASFTLLPEFTYTEHALFFQSGLTLPTRTTVIMQGDVGFKRYTSPNPSDAVATAGMGNASGRQLSRSAPGVTQLMGSLRIAQGITDGTGVSLTGQYQRNLQKSVRFLNFTETVVTDDEFFDDHYAYEGPLLAITLTQLLPGDIHIRASGSLQRREYSDRPAFDLEGNLLDPQRSDRRTVLTLSAEHSFSTFPLNVTMTFDNIVNSSNDPYFTYRNSALSVRLAVNY